MILSISSVLIPAHIGKAIEEYATSQGYSVVREFCGHGVGLAIRFNT